MTEQRQKQFKVRIIANPEIYGPPKILWWVSEKLKGCEFFVQPEADGSGGYNIDANLALQAIERKEPKTVYAGAIEWWRNNISSSDQKTITIPKTACVRI